MTDSTAPQPLLRTWLHWLAGTLAFPIAGLAGTAVVGRVNDAGAALVGGTVAGLVIGVGQTLASRRRLDPRRWIPATAVGMGARTAARRVGRRLRHRSWPTWPRWVPSPAWSSAARRRSPCHAAPHTAGAWAVAVPALWALGWTVTTLGGIHVEDQFTNFGLYGALTFSALSGLLLHRLLPYQEIPQPRDTPTPAPVAG